MALTNKKPSVTAAIGMKPSKDDLGAPDSLDKGMVMHEAEEPPAEEGTEESGADLLASMTQPLVDAGLSDGDARSLLADVLDAACKTLRGGKESAEPAAEGGADPMERSPYGR